MTSKKESPHYTNFGVWKEGHKLVIGIYRITRKFPKEEQFGLVAQMRRSAVSITSNIAEGYGRKSKADKIHFYYIARGSLTELENQIMIARDVGYLKPDVFCRFFDQFRTVHQLLDSFIAKAKSYDT